MTPLSSPPSAGTPAPPFTPGQLADLHEQAASLGYSVVFADGRFCVTDGGASVFGTKSIGATFAFLKGCKHTLRAAEIAAQLAAGAEL